MYNIIYIADNDIDLMGIPIAEYGSNTEIPQDPVEDKSNSELSFVAGKLFVSFGTLLVCIVIFIVLISLFKKKFSLNKESYEYEDVQDGEEDEIGEKEEPAAVLNTPNSINKCIRTFLENTRNI